METSMEEVTKEQRKFNFDVANDNYGGLYFVMYYIIILRARMRSKALSEVLVCYVYRSCWIYEAIVI